MHSYKKINLKIIYSIFISLLPLFTIYKSPIPYISAGEFILILFSFLAIVLVIRNPKTIIIGKDNINIDSWLFFLALLLITLVSLIFLDNTDYSFVDIFLRFIRLALWAFTISILGFYFFDFLTFKKWIINIALVASIYIFIQFVFWNLIGINLPSLINIGFITPMTEEYLESERLVNYYKDFYYRPSSFFEEPESFSTYTFIGLVILLFSKNESLKRKNIIKSLVLSLGIFLSTSTTGIYLVIFIWTFFLIRKFNKNDLKSFIKGVYIFFFSSLITTFSLIYTENTFFIEQILSKPFNFEDSARLGDSYSLFSNLEGLQKLIGVGFGNEDFYLNLNNVYYNSITVIILSAGYMGVILFTIFAYRLLRYKTSVSLILAISYIILCFGTSILYSSLGILYLTIIFYGNKNINKLKAKRTRIHSKLKNDKRGIQNV